MLLFKRFFLLGLVTLLLSGCHQYSEYQYLLAHQDVLKNNLEKCSAGELPAASQTCMNAEVVKQVLNDYFNLQIAQGQRYYEAQQELTDFASKLQAAGNNAVLRQQIISNQQSELAGYDQVFLSVQENFGKLIMLQESKLTGLRAKQQTLLTQLRNTIKTANQLTLKQQLNNINQELVRTEQLVEAMLALVGLNSSQ